VVKGERMESQFLESFVAVIEHGSIAEAARHLDLRPAAISLRIRSLESECGTLRMAPLGRRIACLVNEELGVSLVSD
jgi:DNA-binding transcriptional LysR family regulator